MESLSPRAEKLQLPGGTEPGTVLTIGHSTRSLEELVQLLKANGVERVVDVRTIPRSRTNPQFNKETLPHSLAPSGVAYRHAPGLGGLRRPYPQSMNGGWRNKSFHGYADYMQTPAFVDELDALMKRAADERVALMCAEAVPWRCHRFLISDALSARGVPVEHIVSGKRRQPHRITPWATVEGARVTYPPPAAMP